MKGSRETLLEAQRRQDCGSRAASFSVVMCNLDEIMFIEQSLNSLRNQTMCPQEIIVVDGGSTDGSLEVAQALADKVYSPVKGLARARVIGVFSSKGRFICSANSDTIYPRCYLENASRHLLDEKVNAVTGPHVPITVTHLDLSAKAQAALSYISYTMLPKVYEHNVCFNKNAFIKSIKHFRGFLMSKISNLHADIGTYLKFALNPRWQKDLLVYTRLPTHGFSVRNVLGNFSFYRSLGRYLLWRYLY